jgi:hypothetical protein
LKRAGGDRHGVGLRCSIAGFLGQRRVTGKRRASDAAFEPKGCTPCVWIRFDGFEKVVGVFFGGG